MSNSSDIAKISDWKIFWLGWKDKVFLKQMASVAFPILISNTINTCLQLVDQLMLASLGTKTLNAITYVNLIYFFTGIVFFGIGSATAIFLSRLFTQKDINEMNQIKAIAITLGWVFSIFTILMAEFFPSQILSLYTNDPEIIAIGTVFFHHIAYGQPFFAVAGVYIYIFRILGYGKTAMLGSIIAFATNSILNYVLIFGHFGAPALGVLGAAIATNLARINMMIFYLLRIGKLNPHFKLRIKDFLSMPSHLFMVVLKTTLLLILGDSIWAICLNLYSSIFGHMGNDASATYSIALMFRQITIMITFSMAPAIIIVMGGIIGNTHTTYDQIKAIALKCQGFGFVLSLIIGLSLSVISPFLLHLFYINIPNHILESANMMVIFLALSLPILTVNQFFGAGIFRAGGDTKNNLIYICIFNVCISVPLSYYLGYAGYAPFLVFIGTYIGDFLRCIANILHFMYGKWLYSFNTSSHHNTQNLKGT